MNDLKQRIKTKRDKEDSLLGTKLNVTIDQNNRYLQEHFRMNGNTVEKIMCYKSLQVLGNEVFP